MADWLIGLWLIGLWLIGLWLMANWLMAYGLFNSYNKRIFLEKNIDDNKILTIVKKHSYFLKCEILKL
jgi:hypothetical protein